VAPPNTHSFNRVFALAFQNTASFSSAKAASSSLAEVVFA
jgi:hypothetical protein